MSAKRITLCSGFIAFLSLVSSVSSVFALDKMVRAVHATPADLAAVGMGGIDGTGISVGIMEAGDGVALTTNLFLPAANISLVPQGALTPDIVTNHATEVTGVIVSQGAIYRGIAPASSIEASGISGPVQVILNGQNTALSAAQGGFGARSPIMNMSFGLDVAAGQNNGTNIRSQWLDWAAPTGGGPVQDILFVVAGNEGSPGVPSDAFNCINVGASGRRVAGNVVYDQQATYNTSNMTGDTSPITHRGRLKTDLIAPGGDPGGLGAVGTFNAPPAFNNQFITTGGGQWEFIGTDAGGNPRYTNDDFNGGGLSDDSALATDTQPGLIPGPPFPPRNPGPNLGGNDALQAMTIAGTSYAAPMVSGAAALIAQKAAAIGASADHRVLKAVQLNGASKRTPDGTAALTDKSGFAWTRDLSAAAGFTKADPIGGGNVPIQTGLDSALGTGQLDVVRSARNYLGGRQAPGPVNPIGWNLQTNIGSNGVDSYTFANISGEFTATLCWDRRGIISNVLTANGIWDTEDANGNGVLEAGEDTLVVNGVLDQESFTMSALNDLDLELWQLPAAGAPLRVDFSTSDIDNVEHIWMPNLALGNYRLDVLNRSAAADSYAVAWMVPEPGAVAMLLMIVSLPALMRRDQRRGL